MLNEKIINDDQLNNVNGGTPDEIRVKIKTLEGESEPYYIAPSGIDETEKKYTE